MDKPDARLAVRTIDRKIAYTAYTLSHSYAIYVSCRVTCMVNGSRKASMDGGAGRGCTRRRDIMGCSEIRVGEGDRSYQEGVGGVELFPPLS